MNFLKPIIVGTFAFFALNLNAQIQQNPASSNTIALYAQDNLDELTTELSLSSDQVAKIQGLNGKVVQKIQAIQRNTQMDAAKKRNFISGNKEDHRRVMSTILTSDQFTTYEELMTAKASDRTEDRTKVQEIEITH
jgi:hypothetical protein